MSKEEFEKRIKEIKEEIGQDEFQEICNHLPGMFCSIIRKNNEDEENKEEEVNGDERQYSAENYSGKRFTW